MLLSCNAKVIPSHSENNSTVALERLSTDPKSANMQFRANSNESEVILNESYGCLFMHFSALKQMSHLLLAYPSSKGREQTWRKTFGGICNCLQAKGWSFSPGLQGTQCYQKQGQLCPAHRPHPQSPVLGSREQPPATVAPAYSVHSPIMTYRTHRKAHWTLSPPPDTDIKHTATDMVWNIEGSYSTL